MVILKGLLIDVMGSTTIAEAASEVKELMKKHGAETAMFSFNGIYLHHSIKLNNEDVVNYYYQRREENKL